MIQPTPKPVPARGNSPHGRSIGSIHRNAFPVFIYESVLERILDYSEQDPSRELGGFLLGGLHDDERFREDGRTYIEIRNFLPAVDARSRHASLTFTHDTWAAMTRQIDERHPNELVLGWHHTHPDFGVFLSGYDLFIHRNFFSERWQVALVVDPRRCELGFFQWRGDDVVDCGFVCVREPEET